MSVARDARPLDLLYVRSLFRPADFGGNRYPWEVTKRLAERGHRVRVVTPRPAGPLPGPTGAELVHYPASRRTPLETFVTNALFSRLAVERSLRARPADFLVLSSYEVALGNLIARKRSLPAIFIYHSRFHSDAVERVRRSALPLGLLGPPLERFMRWVELVTFRSAAGIVAVSPYSQREIEARLGGDVCGIRVIPTGVDADFFMPGDRTAARRALGLRADERVLLVVGRLARVKRYERALEALAELRREDPRFVLLVAGRGPEEAGLRRLAGDLRLAEAVRFEGFLDGEALRLRYQAADAQLCTSDFENWSLALLEGLACGLPVLGVPRGGVPELLDVVSDGLIAADVAPSAIAALVRRWFDGDELATVSVRARDLVLRRFAWDRVVDQLEAYLVETAQVPVTSSA